jgi:hypothetical protein
MRNRNVLTVVLISVAGVAIMFSAVASARHTESPSDKPAPTSSAMTSRLSLSARMPSFSRQRSAQDVPPLRGYVFGSRRDDLALAQSRRVQVTGDRAVFAAFSRDGAKVCFALTDSAPDPVWGVHFCGGAATIRVGTPLLWSTNVVRSPTGGKMSFVWGVAGTSVDLVTAHHGGKTKTVSPTADGIFLFDVSKWGGADELEARRQNGELLERERLPSLGG